MNEASKRFQALSPAEQFADLTSRYEAGILEAKQLLSEAWKAGDTETVEICRATLAELRRQQANLKEAK